MAKEPGNGAIGGDIAPAGDLSWKVDHKLPHCSCAPNNMSHCHHIMMMMLMLSVHCCDALSAKPSPVVTQPPVIKARVSETATSDAKNRGGGCALSHADIVR